MSEKIETFRQLCWSRIRRHKTVGIVAQYDAIRASAEPVEEWCASIHARATELLGAVGENPTVEAAAAALKAWHMAKDSSLIAKAAADGASVRAYRYLESQVARSAFQDLAAAIASGIANLPETHSKQEHISRVAEAHRLSVLTANLARGGSVGGDSYLVALVRSLGAIDALPPVPAPRPNDEKSTLLNGGRAKPPAEPRRWKWATMFKGEAISPSISE